MKTLTREEDGYYYVGIKDKFGAAVKTLEEDKDLHETSHYDDENEEVRLLNKMGF